MFSFHPLHGSSLSCSLLSTKSSRTFAFSVFESVSLMLRSHLVFDQVKLATLNKFKSKRSSCLARLTPKHQAAQLFTVLEGAMLLALLKHSASC